MNTCRVEFFSGRGLYVYACKHASCILVMISLLCLGVYHLMAIKAKKTYTMLCSGGGVSGFVLILVIGDWVNYNVAIFTSQR